MLLNNISGDQALKTRDMLDLKHTTNFFKSLASNPVDKIVYFLYSRGKMYFARVFSLCFSQLIQLSGTSTEYTWTLREWRQWQNIPPLQFPLRIGRTCSYHQKKSQYCSNILSWMTLNDPYSLVWHTQCGTGPTSILPMHSAKISNCLWSGTEEIGCIPLPNFFFTVIQDWKPWFQAISWIARHLRR